MSKSNPKRDPHAEPETTPAPPDNNRVRLPALDPQAYRRPYWATYDPTTPEGRRLRLKCSQPGDFKAADLLGQPIPLTHLHASVEELTDPDTGEQTEATRVLLIGPAGQTVECWSVGVGRFIAAVLDAYGQPPYDPPLLVRIDSYRTRNGRSAYRFSVDDPEGGEE